MLVLKTLVVIAVLMAVLLGWISVQRAYRRFACRHPEAGPFREEGRGCVSCAKAAECKSGGTAP